MDEKQHSTKYLRTCIRQQLKGKPHWPLVQPLRAEYDRVTGLGKPLVLVTDIRNGNSVHVPDDSWGHRAAILKLMHEDLPQEVRLREYLRAAAGIPENLRGVHETPFYYFQQDLWTDLIGDAQYNPTLHILDTEGGPVFRVRHGNYVCGWLEINKALQYWDVNTLRKELSKLYYIGVQLTEVEEHGLGLMDLPSGTTYEPLES